MGQLRCGDLHGLEALRYLPNDPTRQNAAERVSECACLLLFLHELAHVRGCHLEILAEELAVTEYREICSDPIGERESLLRRALELEADTLAIANSLSIWKGLAAETGRHAIQGLSPITAWLIAAELLFWVMSCAVLRSRAAGPASHPAMGTRYFNLCLFRGQKGQDNTEVVQAIEQNDRCIGRWVSRHKLPSSLLSPVDEFSEAASAAASDEWTQLRLEIERRWDRIDELQALRAKRVDSQRSSAIISSVCTPPFRHSAS